MSRRLEPTRWERWRGGGRAHTTYHLLHFCSVSYCLSFRAAPSIIPSYSPRCTVAARRTLEMWPIGRRARAGCCPSRNNGTLRMAAANWRQWTRRGGERYVEICELQTTRKTMEANSLLSAPRWRRFHREKANNVHTDRQQVRPSTETAMTLYIDAWAPV